MTAMARDFACQTMAVVVTTFETTRVLLLAAAICPLLSGFRWSLFGAWLGHAKSGTKGNRAKIWSTNRNTVSLYKSARPGLHQQEGVNLIRYFIVLSIIDMMRSTDEATCPTISPKPKMHAQPCIKLEQLGFAHYSTLLIEPIESLSSKTSLSIVSLLSSRTSLSLRSLWNFLCLRAKRAKRAKWAEHAERFICNAVSQCFWSSFLLVQTYRLYTTYRMESSSEPRLRSPTTKFRCSFRPM